MRRFLQIALLLLFSNLLSAQTDNLRVMYYNLLDYPNSDPGREVYFRKVNRYLNADVILVTELKTATGANTILNQALNVYGTTHYQKAIYYTGNYSENLLYYNSEKLALYSQDVIYTSLRDINEYVLYYKSANLATSDTIFFYFYVAHLKASTGFENDRLAEVNQFLNHLNSIPNAENVFFGGDFNLYTSAEPAYQAIVNNMPYVFHDPLPAGNWHSSSTYSLIHTQSTRTTDFGGGSTGGLDDRFDFILFTGDVLSGSHSVQYVNNSCMAFGNDGNHLNKALIDLPVNPNVPDSVIQALYYMSDHLPAVCDLSVAASVDTTKSNIVITEISYNPPESGTDSLEFIELYNNSVASANLAGYTLSSAVDYIFPSVTINPGEFLVIGVNASAMLHTFGVTALQWTSGGLNNDGELILLKNNAGITVDSVNYDDVAPWPTSPDGTGPSLVLCDPDADNSLGSNWQASQHFVVNNGAGVAIYASPGFTECNFPPVADFISNQTQIVAGESVTFTDLSANNPTSWSWTFEGGDPVTSSLQNPIVTYNTEGTFDVVLTASNSSGSNTLTKSGYITVLAPFIGNLMITEIMQNPSFVTDTYGEWFEIFNPTNSAINMNGWKIKDNGIDQHTINSQLIVPAKGFVTLGINSNSGLNGEYVCNYQYATFFLANADDEIILLDPANNEIDRVEYDGGINWPSPNGASMVFTGTPSADNNDYHNWTTATLREPSFTGTTGDKGSPGTNGTGQNLISPAFDLNLKVYLEGPFNGSNMNTGLTGLTDFPLNQPYAISPWNYFGSESVAVLPNSNIVDWILIELRDATSVSQATESNSIAIRAAFLLSNGEVVDLDGSSLLHFTNTITNQLYVAVFHRNHIPVISENALVNVSGVYAYDFTSGMNQVHGGISGHKELTPGIWGMIAGDADASRLIDNNDKSIFWNNQAGKKGYLRSDLNMDAQVGNKDKDEYWLPNLGKGSQVP